MVDDSSNEGLRVLLREEGVTFQRLKTWKGSTDPGFAAEKARIERLRATHHRTHQEQGSMIRPYVTWRNHHADDLSLRRIVHRANAA